MPVTLLSANLPALVLEVAERLRSTEAALTPAQNRVTINYGNSASSPRIVTITASLPFTRSRVAADGGTKMIYNDYAPVDSLVLTDTPLDGMAVESLAEALGVAIEDLEAAERAKVAGGDSLPTGVGTTLTYSGSQASFTAQMAYTISFDATGKPVYTVTNHVA